MILASKARFFVLMSMTAVPSAVAKADPRLVRPRDLAIHYVNPSAEVARLVAGGVLLRVAGGYYAVVPEARRGEHWRPSPEAAALALVQADYGRDQAALMGVSAARVLGALPRAHAGAVVAVPKQRPALDSRVGRLVFVVRDVTALGLQRVDTELARGWVTTAAQTVLDLADRPGLGGLEPADVVAAIRHLAGAIDLEEVAGLADAQRKRAAYRRVVWILGTKPPAWTRPATAAGLERVVSRDPHEYGLVPR